MEVNRIDAAVQTEVYAMMVLTDKPEVGRTDAALRAKELTEIYSTTPKGWHGAKKGKLYLIDWISEYNSRGLYLYPRLIRVINEHD